MAGTAPGPGGAADDPFGDGEVDDPAGALGEVAVGLADAEQGAADALGECLRARGKGGRFSAWTHAIWSFVRGYLLRLGFLDGRNGLILACLTAQGTYWRYRWAGMEHDLGEK